ncbi:MAG: Lrp/AsnC family transcriptional regulator [Clostridiales bacterium]|jgi:Lrp/AsnC family leucine-responsive transcriptional regulator|nr:Lrp/AsnC family transcriptional regulator [Clostridiales bacterium]
MDKKDVQIIKHLVANARINASDISKDIGLSTSAVIERIRKLEKSGIISGYTAILDPRKVNLDVTAIITVVIEHPRYNDRFIKAVMENMYITECHYMAGDHDFYLKVVTQNTNTLQDILNDIKRIEGVAKTKTSIVLNSPKNEIAIVPDANIRKI